MSNKLAQPDTFRTKAGICEIRKHSLGLHRYGIRGVFASILAQLYEALGLQKSINEIPRSAIQRIESVPPAPPHTRGYFTVYYLHDETLNKRLIILPGSWSRGGEEYKIAIQALTNSGFDINAG